MRVSLTKQDKVHVAAHPADDTLTGGRVRTAGHRTSTSVLPGHARHARWLEQGKRPGPDLAAKTVATGSSTGPMPPDGEDTWPAGVHAVSRSTRVSYTLVHTLQWCE